MTISFLDVSDVSPRIAYTATSSQTIFVVPFVFHDEAHLAVYQNDVLLTLTTHYTVTGEDVETGGTVVLVTGATVSDSIVIVRVVPYELTTHIAASGPLDIPAINIQFSLFLMMQQQLVANLLRSLYQPASDAEDFDPLPIASLRASKYLFFGADGQPTAVSSVSTSVAATAYILTLLDDATAAAARTTLGAMGITDTQTITSTDAGAAQGPTLDLFRDSASPAAADVIGGIDINGRDSAGNKQLYARIVTSLQDPTSTSEDATIFLQQVVAGTLTTMLNTTAGGVAIPGTLAVTGTMTGKFAAPTVQRFTSGTAQTYTPTAGIVRIKVRMVGGGGGGGGATANNGSSGNGSVFGSWTAQGGLGGSASAGAAGAGGSGGSDSTGTLIVRVLGGGGGPGGNSATAGVIPTGNFGGSTPFGVGPSGNQGTPAAPPTNSGAGGGGGGANSGTNAGSGGGGGEYVEFYMTAAQVGASQTYTVGTGGAGGAAGTNAGRAGAAGIILIEEFYS